MRRLINFERVLTENFAAITFCLIIIFGVAIRIVTPPYQVADEINHFARAWQVSEGKLLAQTEQVRLIEDGDNPTTKNQVGWSCKGGRVTLHDEGEKFFVAEVPRSLMPPEFVADIINKYHLIKFDMAEKFISTPLDVEVTEWHLIPNTGSYSPLAYLPQAVIAFLGRSLNFCAGTIYYLMSLGALIFCAFCVFGAMKLLPEKKILIFLLAMMPMFLTEISSTSADAIIYGATLFGAAWLLSLRRRGEKISSAEIFGLITLAITLGLLKQVYGAILLLYFLIPRARFNSTGQFIGLGLSLLIIDLTISSAWLYLSSDGGRVPLFTGFYMGLEGIDAVAQKQFMLAHPTEFLTAFAASVIKPDIWFAKTFIGVLGIVNLYFPIIFYFAYVVMLIIGATVGDLNLKFRERLLMIFIALVTMLGVFAVEYLIWSPVGAELIAGVQGRYFIPVALIAFASLSLFNPPRFSFAITFVFGVASALSTLWILFSRLY